MRECAARSRGRRGPLDRRQPAQQERVSACGAAVQDAATTSSQQEGTIMGKLFKRGRVDG